MALTLLADRWARERGGQACGLTVDHGLRPESGAEVRGSASWLRRRAFRHEILAWAGRKAADRHPGSGARGALPPAADWCREHGVLHLLTAHHREDQTETHLIRRRAGSGIDGLAGMSAVRELAGLPPGAAAARRCERRLAALLAAEGQPSSPTRATSTRPSSAPACGGGRQAYCTRRGSICSARSSGADRRVRSRARVRREHEAERASRPIRAPRIPPASPCSIRPCLAGSMPRDRRERAARPAVTTVIGGAAYPPGRGAGRPAARGARAAARRGRTLGGCRFVPLARPDAGDARIGRRRAAASRSSPAQRVVWDRRFAVRTAARLPAAIYDRLSGLAGRARSASMAHAPGELGEARRRLPRCHFAGDMGRAGHRWPCRIWLSARGSGRSCRSLCFDPSIR